MNNKRVLPLKVRFQTFLRNVKKTICIENRAFIGVWGKPISPLNVTERTK